MKKINLSRFGIEKQMPRVMFLVMVFIMFQICIWLFSKMEKKSNRLLIDVFKKLLTELQKRAELLL